MTKPIDNPVFLTEFEIKKHLEDAVSLFKQLENVKPTDTSSFYAGINMCIKTLAARTSQVNIIWPDEKG